MKTRPIRRSPWYLYGLALAGLALLAAGVATWYLWPKPKPTARVQLVVRTDPPNILNRPEIRLSGDAFLRYQA
jgi:hypothetical protein